MNIGYVEYKTFDFKNEIEKCLSFKEKYFVIKEAFSIKVNKLFNKCIKKEYSNVFFIFNKNKKSIDNLIETLKKYNIEKVIYEKELNINYKKIEKNEIIKFCLPEIVNYIKRVKQMKYDQIYIVVKDNTEDNCKIIDELIISNKIVNIITDNKYFFQKEKEINNYNNEMFISVSNNKRRALKKAELIVNLDLNSLDNYNVNNDAIIIDAERNMKVPKFFNGDIIKSITINATKKRFKDFLDIDISKYDYEELIAIQILKKYDFDEKRNFIKIHKISVVPRKNIKSENHGKLVKCIDKYT